MIDKISLQLKSCVDQLAANYTNYVQNPSKDFSRNRVLTFEKVIMMLLKMGGQTLCRELLNLDEAISSSAFVQSRYKIKPEALYDLFTSFVKRTHTRDELPVFAVDGSDINIPCMPNDEASYFYSSPTKKAYNLLHLNALFDLKHQLYEDVYIQKRRHFDERQALIEMMEVSPFCSSFGYSRQRIRVL